MLQKAYDYNMIPEFNVKQIDSRLSSDLRAHLNLYLMILTVVVFFIITKGIHHQITTTDIVVFSVAIGLDLLQALSRFMPVAKDWALFNSGGAGALIIYNLSTSILLVWFVPFYSPFILLIAPLMFITIYYRGMTAFLISFSALIVVVIAATIVNGTPPVSGARFYPYVAILLGAAFGSIVQRAGSIDSELRNEFKRISNRVELERQQLSSLIDSMTDVVLAVDETGKILFHNKATLYLLDAQTPLNGKSLFDFATFYDEGGRKIDLFKSPQQTGNISRTDLHFFTKSHEKIDVYIDIAPINDAPNQPQTAYSYIVTLRDITKEKSLDEERDEFLAVTSHELRTPVTTAEASISLIMSPKISQKLDADDQKIVKQAHDNVIYMSELVNDLILLSKAEKSSLDIEIQTVNPGDILHRLAEEFRDSISAKNLQLSLNVGPSVEPIATSSVYLYEVLQNFVSNAIKYTEQGSITLNVARDGRDTVFSVEDTGVGIGASDKPKIFEKYYRVEDYRTRETRGTGLGLYIASKLCNYLGAKMWFESELNKGSTFYVRIPLQNSTNEPRVESKSPGAVAVQKVPT